MTVDLVVGPKPAEALTEPVFVEDLDKLLKPVMCSCAAGDDNPY